MATDIERLVVSLDADISRLSRQLAKATGDVDTWGRKAEASARRSSKRVSDAMSGANDNRGGIRQDQITNLRSQLLDVGTSLSGGASPLQVLSQQGAQVYEALASGPGGAGAAVKELAGRFTALLTPMRLAAGGVLGIAGSAALLGINWDDAQRRIELGLSGIGRRSGATVNDINKVAEAVAATGKMTSGEARQAATGFASQGVDKANLAGLVGLVPGWAKLFDKDIDQAADELAKLFSDPVKAIEAMDRRLGVLDGSTLAYIRTLGQQGDAQKAIQVAIKEFGPELERVQNLTTGWARAWRELKKYASEAKDAIGAAVQVGPGSLDDHLTQVQERLASQRRSAALATRNAEALRGRGYSDARIESIVPNWRSDRAALESLERQERELKEAIEARDKATARAPAAERAQAASEIVRRLDPDAQAIADVTAEYERIGKSVADTIADPSIKIDGGIENAFALYGALGRRIQALKDDYEKGGAAAAAMVRQADFSAKVAGMSAYGRAVAEITTRFDEAKKAAEGTANAAAKITSAGTVRDRDLTTLDREYMAKPSGYAKGVADAPEEYRQLYLRAGKETGVDPNLLAAQGWKESRWRRDALSPAGARGIAQFMPATATRFGVDVNDPESSIMGQARYMKWLLDRFGGNERLAAAGYNAGEGRVDSMLKKGGDMSSLPAETRDYVATIFKQGPDAKSQVDMLQRWNIDLANQSRVVDENRTAHAKSLAEIDRVTRARELENEMVQAGKTISEDDRKIIDEKAEAYARLRAAQRQVEYQDTVRVDTSSLGRTADEQSAHTRALRFGNEGEASYRDAYSQISTFQSFQTAKGETSGFLKSLNADLQNGAKLGDALRNSLQRVVQTLSDKAIDTFVSRLFGSMGGGGSDGLGGMLGKIASAFGGSGGGGGAFADLGNGAVMLAGGGQVSGPGTSTSDSILARLSKGEFSLRERSSTRLFADLKAALAGCPA